MCAQPNNFAQPTVRKGSQAPESIKNERIGESDSGKSLCSAIKDLRQMDERQASHAKFLRAPCSCNRNFRKLCDPNRCVSRLQSEFAFQYVVDCLRTRFTSGCLHRL